MPVVFDMFMPTSEGASPALPVEEQAREKFADVVSVNTEPSDLESCGISVTSVTCGLAERDLVFREVHGVLGVARDGGLVRVQVSCFLRH